MNTRGRVAVCGAISGYNNKEVVKGKYPDDCNSQKICKW